MDTVFLRLLDLEDERARLFETDQDPAQVEHQITIDALHFANMAFLSWTGSVVERAGQPLIKRGQPLVFLRLALALEAVERGESTPGIFTSKRSVSRPVENPLIDRMKGYIAAAVYQRKKQGNRTIAKAAANVARDINHRRELATFVWKEPTVAPETIKNLYDKFESRRKTASYEGHAYNAPPGLAGIAEFREAVEGFNEYQAFIKAGGSDWRDPALQSRFGSGYLDFVEAAVQLMEFLPRNSAD
jgi:hypothetical protein